MQRIPLVPKVAVSSCFFLNRRALFTGHCAEWPPREAVSGHSPVFRPKCLMGLTELTRGYRLPYMFRPKGLPPPHSSLYLVSGKSEKIFTRIPFTGLRGIQQRLPQGRAYAHAPFLPAGMRLSPDSRVVWSPTAPFSDGSKMF